MRLSTVIRYAGFITLIALIYTHMQMRIFALAYEGKQKEKHITQLQDTVTTLTYNIMELKSVNNLAYKVLTKDSDLQFCDTSQIVRVTTAQDNMQLSMGEGTAELKHPANPLASFLSFITPAEAKTASKKISLLE